MTVGRGIRKAIGFALRWIGFLVYWLTTRLTVFIIFVWLVIYFTLNAGPFPSLLSQALRSVLPGFLHFETLQISPVPWQVNILGLSIRLPNGREVVSAKNLAVSIDAIPLSRFLLGQSERLDLIFDSVRLREYFCEIAFDSKMDLEFLRAFVWPPRPGPPSVGKGPEVYLRFKHIVAEEGRFHLAFPEWELWLEGLGVDTMVEVWSNGRVIVKAPVVTFGSGQGLIHAAPDVTEIPRQTKIEHGRVENFVFDTDHFSISRAFIAIEGMLVQASGALAFPSGSPLSYDAKVAVAFPKGSTLVAHSTHAKVQGPLSIEVQGSGNEHDPRFSLSLESESLEVFGLSLGHVRASIVGGKVDGGKGPYSFRVSSLSAEPRWGSIKLEDGHFYPLGRFDPSTIEASATLEIAHLNPFALLEALGVSAPPAIVPVPTDIGGRLHLSGRITAENVKTYEAFVAARLRGNVQKPALLQGETLVNFAADLTWSPQGRGPTLAIKDFYLASGADSGQMRGFVDFGSGRLRLFGHVRKELDPVFQTLNVQGRGSVSLAGISVTGSLREPTITAILEASELGWLGWQVDKLEGSLVLQKRELALRALKVAAPLCKGSISELKVLLSTRPTINVKDANITDLNLAKVPYLAEKGIRGFGHAHIEYLSLETTSPLRTLEFSCSLDLASIYGWNRALKHSTIEAQANRGVIDVHLLEGYIGKGVVRGQMRYDLSANTIDASFSADALPLEEVSGLSELEGQVSVQATLKGKPEDPEAAADITLEGLSFANIRTDMLSIHLSKKAGQDLMISSENFLPKMRLDPSSRLTFEEGGFSMLQLGVEIEDLRLEEVFNRISPKTFSARFTGRLDLSASLSAKKPLIFTLVSPPGGIAASFLEDEIVLENTERMKVELTEDGDIVVSGIAFSAGPGGLRLCGVLFGADGETRLLVRGPIPLALLRIMKDVVSQAQGQVFLEGLPGHTPTLPRGCPMEMLAGEGALEIGGAIVAPTFRGAIRTGSLSVMMRHVPDVIELESGAVMTVLSEQPGDFTVSTKGPLRGRWGDGRFAVEGSALFRGWLPDTGEVRLSGAGLRYSSPGSYYLVFSPRVVAKFRELTGPEPERGLTIAGRVDITEGSFHKNFDVVRRAFSGIGGQRVAERSEAPLATRAPWLAKAKLDLTVTGSRFGVRSKLPFGSTDLDVALDLAVKGTIEEPEIWNRVEILPGGKVVYSLVRREFEITRGTLDFDGNPSKPIIDLTAQTVVEESGVAAEEEGTSKFEPEGQHREGGILVNLAISGRFPDLDISLSSAARDLDQTDLQYLLLFGTTQQGAREGKGASIDVGLLTEDFTNLAANLLLSPFVDAIRFGVTPTGGVNTEVQAHLGSRLRFQTKVLQEAGSSRYRAGFQVQLTDRLFLEGRMRVVEQSTNPSEVGRRYEAKLRYRIPVE